MATSKKFGTFGGVFTPSILTILGVIMYLRLPWIIAQGGLYYAIVIIIVAHVVSVTTGLSVASIATDKKVQAGGNYYIISRSLGLPIGGTLGIALFVGLSFSISLYIIGFSESLLSVLNIVISKDTIRLYGSVALVILTIIVFISTSLAIKTQYLILAAVLVSLVSIFLGGSNLPADQYVLNPVENNETLFVIFGIFFPAVTGFTAGVQMSGDLKDPKKAIPLGTIAAIGFGFVIYLSLAVFIAFNISSEKLLNNPNILVEIAWIPQLVIAGIWGATLSSAMGSILGAPRILQATSRDKVTPRFFAKGYGGSNEPRRALIFTFLIAEAGILIGDLNAIARIVTIFFLSTYGLINLSYAVESWASSDFRPSFKVPIWVGVLGAIVCGLLMFELDVMAFAAATIILALLYLYLKRKELTLETGDTWGSFWSSVVRSGLQRLNESVEHKRNWRPNILLFRGKTDSRKHLLDYGKWFAGKIGIISDFELIETNKETLQFTKAAQMVKTNESESGIFNRRYECRDIYTGIEQVAQFYGFSGVEPNTILLGWPRNAKNPEKVVNMLLNLIALDYNILLLDKNKDDTTESYKTIDIWWRGGSNNAALALALMRFMHASGEWKDARLRILIIVDDSTLINKVHSNMKRILQELRQDAEVKVINNAIEQRSFREIMIVESANSDLTIIGLPDLKSASESFVKHTNSFIHDLKSVLLISASSFFEPYYIGIEKKVEQHVKRKLEQVKDDFSQIKLPANDILAQTLGTIHSRLNNSINELYSGYIIEIEQELKKLGDNLKTITDNQFQVLSRKSANLDAVRLAKLTTRIQNEILFNSWRTINAFRENELDRLKLSLQQGIENIIEQQNTIINDTPESQIAYYSRENASVIKGDPFFLRLYKARKLLANRLFKKEISLPVKLRMFVRYHTDGYLRKQLLEQIKQIGLIGYNSISQLQKIFNRIQDLLKNLEISIKDSGKLEAIKFKVVVDNIDSLFNEYSEFVEYEFNKAVSDYASSHHVSFQNKISHFDTLNINRKIKRQFHLKKAAVEKDDLISMPEEWLKNMSWMIAFASMELTIILFQNRLAIMLKKWLDELELNINTKLKVTLTKIEKVFSSYIENKEYKTIKNVISESEIFDLETKIDTKELTREVQASISELPEKFEVMSEASFRAVKEKQLGEQEIVSVYLRKMVGYLIDTEFMYDLNEKVQAFSQRIKEHIAAIDDTQRLIVSALTTSASKDTESDQSVSGADIDQIIGRGIQRLAKIKEDIDGILKETVVFAEERLEASFDKMNPYLITNTTNNLKQYIFSHEQRKVLSRLERTKQNISGLISKVAVNLQYSQSEGILFARKLNRMTENEAGHIDKMISLTRTFSPNTYILQSLPRYYKQLFIGEGSISRQFLVSRKKSIEQAERIIQRYNEGFKGALLIKGDPRSGKTALSRMISSRHFERKKVYRISPVAGGSIDTDIFIHRINEATNITGNITKVMETLPAKSALIINDLEMWWERSKDGFNVIDLVLQLIDRYSDKVLFIVNANTHFLQLANRIQNFEKSFLGVITCDLFNAKEIETSILQRHRSTGMKFILNERLESDMSDIRMAGLFNEIFKFSKGSIGVALLSWLTMINKFADDKITIKKLKRSDLKILADLESEWQVWLSQFVLHKQLTKTRLVRIFNASEKDIFRTSEALLRSGFLVKNANDSMRINPYIEHLFIEKFSQMGLLWSNL